jgi:hypothetical protein
VLKSQICDFGTCQIPLLSGGGPSQSKTLKYKTARGETVAASLKRRPSTELHLEAHVTGTIPSSLAAFLGESVLQTPRRIQLSMYPWNALCRTTGHHLSSHRLSQPQTAITLVTRGEDHPNELPLNSVFSVSHRRWYPRKLRN